MNQESGYYTINPEGNRIVLGKFNRDMRGVYGFDYATFIGEGIKKAQTSDRVAFYLSIAWQVRRPEFVPDLIKLLDHADSRVRIKAVSCLAYTVNNRNYPRGYIENKEAEHLQKWRTWWKDEGAAFMSAVDTRVDQPPQ